MVAETKMARTEGCNPLPSQSSSNPTKDQKMNNATHITGAPEAPDITKVIENPLNDARRMSSILAGLLEEHFREDMSDMLGAKGKNNFHSAPDVIEDILFSVFKIQDALAHVEAGLTGKIGGSR